MAEENKTGFLEDDQGTPSSMRAMSMLSLVASFIFAWLTLVHPVASANPNALFITFGFLIGAFAPKAIQKFAESKFPPKKDTS